MDVLIYGADTETLDGEPMTLQFFSADTDCSDLFFVNAKNATTKFMQWINKLPRHCLNVIYCHNLDFDLPEFLWGVKEKLISAGGSFEFEIGEWKLSGVYGQPTFCNLSNRQSNKRVLIVDSFSWYTGSLANAAKAFCPDLPKLKRPEGLGEKEFTSKDTDFCAYAMRDAEVAYYIGKSIQRLVQEFDIKQPVSRADMAAKIFRHHFLQHTILQPTKSCILGALKSYHGGKNNVVKGHAPFWHVGVTGMDISSAYPYAMSLLPSFSYDAYKIFPLAKTAKEVPDLGVYLVSGKTENCDWPVIFDHAFNPIQGRFADIWVQGYELNEALRSGELKISKIRGYYYQAERDNRPSPFKSFIDDFYNRKESEPDAVLRYNYKIILNSVYGKFIQTRKNQRVSYTNVDTGETDEALTVQAGGMFNPFIASAITAHTRAYIHQLEHKHKAIHTATDGIYTYEKKPKKVLHSPKKKGLGEFKIEAQGDLVLFRNKCYILYGDKKDSAMASMYFPGKHIVKYAKHGFQGSIFELERLLASESRHYKVARPNRLKESLKRGLPVNKFVERDYTLKIGPVRVFERGRSR